MYGVCNAINAYVLYLRPNRGDTVLETNVIKAAGIGPAFTDLKTNSL